MSFFRKVKMFSQMVAADFHFVFKGPKFPLKDGLVLNGKILETEVRKDLDRKVVKTIAKAEMEITNDMEGPITFINPKYFHQSNSKSFALTKVDGKGKCDRWYSSFSSDEPVITEAYCQLIEMLEKGEIIEDLTLILQSDEKIKWSEKIFFEFDLVDKKSRHWQEISWNEFRKNSDSFWLSFTYRLLEDIYLLKPKLIKILPDCWKSAGEVPICCYKDKNIEHKALLLDTEPIFIDFKQAKVNESK